VVLRSFPARQRVVEQRHLPGVEPDACGGHVLLKMNPAFGAGDRRNVVALCRKSS
jgi:hypothetical protein